ncbi:acyl-CoA dehydrogenase family protein [Catenulispora acidiphila]|uniref:hydrolase n=1 Tax=Catenulispora acidiphila TaxID=304895 RepID=UPI0002E966C3|nr:hydrolase [Catenulispora acidiphila]
MAAEHSAETEAARDLAPEVVAAVVEAGFARFYVPSRFGGGVAPDAAPDYRGLVEAVAAVGLGCASTAWFASLTASLGRMAAFLADSAQEAVWGDGPDPVVVGALMPAGKAAREGDGWRLSGAWPYVSGVTSSDWALLCAMAEGDEGAKPHARFFAVPRSAYTITESWFSVGMRGTGSNTVTVRDVRVAADFTVTREALLAGQGPDAAPAYRAPLRSINGLTFAAPLLGAARAALNAHTASLAAKPAPLADDAAALIGRVDGEIEAAAALLDRVASAAERGEHSPDEVARATRDCALAAELLPAAIDRLVRASGTSAMAETSALQRFWRDLNVGSSHIVLKQHPAAAAYGAALVKKAGAR